MKDGSSIVALGREGNIIGARIGMRKWRTSWVSWLLDRVPFNMPDWMMKIMPLPENTKKNLPIMIKLFTLLDYNVWRMFSMLGCSVFCAPPSKQREFCPAELFNIFTNSPILNIQLGGDLTLRIK